MAVWILVGFVGGAVVGFGIGFRISQRIYPEEKVVSEVVCPECIARAGRETCPWCGSVDIEPPGLDSNRYCNSCNKPVNRF